MSRMRIKYYSINTDNTMLRTDFFFVKANFIITAHINTETNEVSIKEFNGNIIHRSSYSNLRTAKRYTRKLLVSYGVQLSSEVRQTYP